MISVAEMREVEKRAVEAGIDEAILMENAGANAAKIIDSEHGLGGKTVLIFCGTGNNAGDGLVFARHALIFDARVKIFFVKGTKSLKPLPKKHYDTLKKLVDVEFIEDTENVNADILVDAMLGTGIKGDVSEDYKKVINDFNSLKGKKVSLDNPSGIDCDTGEVLGAAVEPDMTITFHEIKKGMNEINSGRIVVADIGIPKM